METLIEIDDQRDFICEADDASENGLRVVGLRQYFGRSREACIRIDLPDPMMLASVLVKELQRESSASIADRLFC